MKCSVAQEKKKRLSPLMVRILGKVAMKDAIAHARWAIGGKLFLGSSHTRKEVRLWHYAKRKTSKR
jgi:hypothetical protein